MRERSSRATPTIGVIMDHVSGESRASLWPGIADAIRAHGGSLLSFAGGCLLDPHDFSVQGNLVYELIDTDRLDGLIIWASSLASDVGPECIPRFCARFRSLPIVSIGLALDGIPGVLLDSYQGMRDAVAHLIETHGRRRLAFIRGPAGHRDAEERYRAYVEALQHYDMPFRPELVSPYHRWYDPGGHTTMRLLLDERRADFDAVVCVNDDLAVQAMETLQARGIRVPEDVSIVGFNDTPLSRAVTPPLTTVPWRMYERGQQAAELLLAMLAGQPPPAEVLLPATLIVRQSCGCFAPSLIDGAPEASGGAASLGRAADLAAVAAALSPTERTPETAQLYDTFVAEVAGETAGGFLPALDRVLRQTVSASGDGLAWQRAISALRRQILPILLGDTRRLTRAEDLLQRARVLVSEHAQRGHLYREWQTQQQSQRLRRINHVLATTTRVSDLMDLLAEQLPQLGIARAYLALYEDPLKPAEWCRVVLAFDADGRRDLGAEGRRVRTRDLAMAAVFPLAPAASLLIQPLHFQDQQLGLVIFEQRSAGDIYEVLREEISVTLKAVMLSERNEALYRQAIEAEQVAQEGRWLAEEADRLKSRFLSMVSHELRTPLVLLVGLSEMMLRERTGDARPPLPAPYRQDLARIHVSAQQLDGLVRDVLDLTRSQMGQLRLMKEPLDLAPVLKAVALVGEQMAHSKGLDWLADIPERLPTVNGDPARLRQVVLNLITNAVKFTTHGQIVLGASADADALTIYVSDTGLGVPLAEQEAIFDEFRQSERTATRGYGGLGIGLAICRELVELHGGTIGVRSAGAEEGGSTFYFTLPALVAGKDALTAQAATAASQVVVLVTAPDSRGAPLADYLAREGFLVESLDASANSDWFSRLLALTPGAVVLDCQPPSARGWQVIDTLRSNPATQDLPVLFYALAGSDAGAMLALDHLPKPLGVTALTQALQRYGLAAEGGDKRSILIVDDDPGIRELHAQVVRSALSGGASETGRPIVQAADGRMALDIMRRSPPALVLLDLMMPELDGMGVLAAMQEDDRLRRIPVIVLTAQALTEPEMARLNLGVAAVLQKDLFTADETLAHVVQALARNKRLGSEMQRTVRKAMAYIHEHYAEPISREDMAAHVGVSPRHLTRCFQQELALAPITYLNRYRVKRAKQLLARGEKNITEIASAVGFASSNYFTDAFRREAGMAPRDYQRRNLAPKS
jgi:signal transduction histidine kinase/AraC-like DNA-binding protein